MASNFEDKAHMAAEVFLKRKDYELIDLHPEGEAFDFVAKSSDGALVFIALAARAASDMEPGLPKEVFDREAMERAAARWLSLHDFEGGTIRFDSIALVILNDRRALLRHHINVLS